MSNLHPTFQNIFQSFGVTPQPRGWKSQGWVPTWAYIPVKDAAHNLVASLYPNEDKGYTRKQVEANARLIAAAPDLLEAAEKALNYITNTESELGMTLGSGDALREAIRKATEG